MELLEEDHEQFGQSYWVVILHGDVSVTIKAPHIALDEELERKGIVLVAVDYLRDQGQFSYSGITVLCKVINCFYSGLDICCWVVLIDIHYLCLLGSLLVESVEHTLQRRLE